MIVRIDAGRITDWDSFHDVFAEAFGFPGWYGRNMAAWIDCMTCLDDPPEAAMSRVSVAPGQVLTLQIDNINALVVRCPDVYAALAECAAFVNWRRIDTGYAAVLALSFYKTS